MNYKDRPPGGNSRGPEDRSPARRSTLPRVRHRYDGGRAAQQMWAAGRESGYAAGFGDGYGLAMRLMAAEWFHRAPCGCGSDGCYVLAADGESPPAEIHVGAA